MSPGSLLDDFRVVAAAALLFAGLPWLLLRVGRLQISLLASVVRVTLFAEVLGMLLGPWRLCLPGSETAAFVLLIGICAWQGGALEVVKNALWWRRNFQKLLMVVDGGAWSVPPALRAIPSGFDAWIDSVGAVQTPSWMWVCVIAGIWLQPLLHIRFLTAAAYSRSLSLQVLTLGQHWTPEGSVAFFAPIAFLSGGTAAAVIRFSNPLLILALAGAAGFAIREMTRSRIAATVGSGVVALIAISPRTGGELGPGGIASIFWLVALGFLIRSRADGGWAALLAFMIEPKFGKSLVIYVGGILVAVLLIRLSQRFLPSMAWAGIALAFAPVFAMAAFAMPDARGLYQYESSAAVIEKIARDLPPKQWLAVSPVQELVFTYGRGWHNELSEFVASYRADQVANPDFRFSFPVKSVFVFVEKKPLDSGGRANPLFSSQFDPATSAYEYYLEREALEFQAASLMSAYASSHENVAIFFEDDELRVYRIDMQSPPPSRPN